MNPVYIQLSWTVGVALTLWQVNNYAVATYDKATSDYQLHQQRNQ